MMKGETEVERLGEGVANVLGAKYLGGEMSCYPSSKSH